jgi:hypothetical protein
VYSPSGAHPYLASCNGARSSVASCSPRGAVLHWGCWMGFCGGGKLGSSSRLVRNGDVADQNDPSCRGRLRQRRRRGNQGRQRRSSPAAGHVHLNRADCGRAANGKAHHAPGEDRVWRRQLPRRWCGGGGGWRSQPFRRFQATYGACGVRPSHSRGDLRRTRSSPSPVPVPVTMW